MALAPGGEAPNEETKEATTTEGKESSQDEEAANSALKSGLGQLKDDGQELQSIISEMKSEDNSRGSKAADDAVDAFMEAVNNAESGFEQASSEERMAMNEAMEMEGFSKLNWEGDEEDGDGDDSADGDGDNWDGDGDGDGDGDSF